MKTILYTIVSGIFVCLITSIDMHTDQQNFKLSEDIVDQIKSPGNHSFDHLYSYNTEFEVSNDSLKDIQPWED
ncbi:hypothetical protein [Psychroserpens sp.]|uniref:hypothetical protein n=1 Tax=Psychroserpens sp. TaxID=2020870 RepID=UPI001B276E18|nr:hypothetical protein [Psychroserpens sp.]MBO6607936.1 hypothetical protein [Psychroserpens sp.]MBO6630636.1 hypothetical protein [Psychroserpens sp.]MBO6654937.1 hypothetical protein [Psychroserpens sp.]MBO6682989.1 hypothetical protein [Psychroserpens sp.]MBO6751294.1 hypothetical protein [Psychroserpens sp.]